MANDPDLLLGKLALERHFITQAQLDECLALLRRYRGDGLGLTLLEIFQRKGYVQPDQLGVLQRESHMDALRTEDLQIGQIAIDNEFATKQQVKAALHRQSDELLLGTQTRLVDLLRADGVLTPQMVRALQKAQERLRAQAHPEGRPTPPAAAPAAPPRPPAGAAPAPTTRPPAEQDDVATVDEMMVPWLVNRTPVSPGQVTALPGKKPETPQTPESQDDQSTLDQIVLPWLKKQKGMEGKPSPDPPG